MSVRQVVHGSGDMPMKRTLIRVTFDELFLLAIVAVLFLLITGVVPPP
jgi:hypothetical protein